MKKLLTLTSLFLIAGWNILFAQEIKWQKSIGGDNMDWVQSIVESTSGGYVFGGHSSSAISGDKNEACIGVSDYWIVKTDTNGIILWQNTIGGSGADELYSIKQTADGGYICAGQSESNISGDKTENCLGNFDYWVVKIDSLGAIQWQNTIGGVNIDKLESIGLTSDGGYICSGLSYSPISGDKTEMNQGGTDFWILKLDSNGNILWQNTIGGSGEELFSTIIQTTDGGFMLAGTSSSDNSVDKSEASLGGTDFWFIKLDNLGNIVWDNTIGGNFDDIIMDVKQTSDEGYIGVGYSYSDISGDITEGTNGISDCLIIKLDSSGNIQWQNMIGGNSGEYVASVDQLSDGSFIIGASTESNISSDITENLQGNADYWLIKVDTAGVVEWKNVIGGAGYDYIFDLIVLSNGEFVCGGRSDSDLSGDKSENSNGSMDFWVMKVTGKYNLIQGNSFADLNSNNINDPAEPALRNKKIDEQFSGRFAFTTQNGNYSVAVLDSGNYEVSPALTIHNFNTGPLSHAVYFNSIPQTDANNDFAFQPMGSFNDLTVTIVPTAPFRPGINAFYALNYTNTGTTAMIPTIVFYPDPNVSFVSSTPVQTTSTVDSVTFTPGILSPFESGQILITVLVDAGVQIGDVINSGASVFPIIGDETPPTNTDYVEIAAVTSFDPNDIIVNRNTLYDTEFPNPPFLHYTIRFQNTGNDTAFVVKILNPIDTTKLDLSTIEFVASSHPVDMRYIYHERNMEYLFENILLPDSNTNEPFSHGFISYRVKPKSNLVVGDTISDFAAIYFDFNDPVLTNTATTEIILQTGNGWQMESQGATLNVYPNPVQRSLTVEFSLVNEGVVSLELYNVYGQRVESIFNNKMVKGNLNYNIDISGYNSGVYLIKLSGAVSKTGTLIKY